MPSCILVTGAAHIKKIHQYNKKHIAFLIKNTNGQDVEISVVSLSFINNPTTGQSDLSWTVAVNAMQKFAIAPLGLFSVSNHLSMTT
jgi:hypothetical protein